MPEVENAVTVSEPEVARGQPAAPTGFAIPDAAVLAGVVGNRTVARALARTPQGSVPGRGLDARSALLAGISSGGGRLSRKEGGTCSCGGTILPGGECAGCMAKQLTSGGMPAEQAQRVVAARQALARSIDARTPAERVVKRPASGSASSAPRRPMARSVSTKADPPKTKPADVTPCMVIPRLLARLENDPATESKIAPMLAPFAVGMDGGWLQRQLDGGSRLDTGLQRDMEQSFGAEFGGVRIHTGSGARKVARHLNAEAVTIGSHIIFNDHAYSPNTREGRQLLRHELAHVVQHGNGSVIPNGIIRIAGPGERSEQEARMVADASAGAGLRLSRVPEPQLNLTSLCEIAADGIAWGVNSALVAAIAAMCVAGTTFTVGALAIPCTALVIGAAAVGAVNSVMWAAILKDAMCGIPITEKTPPQQASNEAAPSAEPDSAAA